MITSGSTKRRSRAARWAPWLVAVLTASVDPAYAEWSFARGGLDSTGATDVALPDEPKVLWTYESGGSGFEATPVVSQGVAYLGDADGTVHAVRTADGSAVWKRSLGETFLLSAAAVLPGTAVFVPDADGVVHCLGLDDGDERWAFETESEIYGGPLVIDAGESGRLLLVPTEGGKLFAIDAGTGEERWVFEIDAPLRCTPTVVNGHALLAGCDGKLHAVRVATGEESGAVDIGGPTGNTAAVRDGVAYFGSEQGEFYAIDASDPIDPVVRWTYRDAKRSQGIRTAASVSGKLIAYANQAKVVYGLSPADGEVLWTHRSRSRIDASPLLIGDGRVLIATTRGRLRLLDGETGETTWEYDAGGSFLASPAASSDRVLVAGADGMLLCFGAKEENHR